MKLLILKYAKVDENILASWKPNPLLPEGVRQAELILDTMLKKFPDLNIKRILSSDIARCAQTAEIMAKKLNLSLVLNADFRGFNVGSGAGVSHSEFFKAHPGQYIKYLKPNERIDDGETPREFYSRVANGFRRLIKNPETDGDMILVTHRSVLDVIYTIALGVQWSNQIYYYEMEYLLLNLTKNKVETIK